MKRINSFIKIGLLVLVLAVGFSKTSEAVQQEVCYTAYIDCGNGTGGYGLVCGSTRGEIIGNIIDLTDAICGY